MALRSSLPRSLGCSLSSGFHLFIFLSRERDKGWSMEVKVRRSWKIIQEFCPSLTMNVSPEARSIGCEGFLVLMYFLNSSWGWYSSRVALFLFPFFFPLVPQHAKDLWGLQWNYLPTVPATPGGRGMLSQPSASRTLNCMPALKKDSWRWEPTEHALWGQGQDQEHRECLDAHLLCFSSYLGWGRVKSKLFWLGCSRLWVHTALTFTGCLRWLLFSVRLFHEML